MIDFVYMQNFENKLLIQVSFIELYEFYECIFLEKPFAFYDRTGHFYS